MIFKELIHKKQLPSVKRQKRQKDVEVLRRRAFLDSVVPKSTFLTKIELAVLNYFQKKQL